ncbi:MAG: hypothetical protein QOE06_321 [Thermoleophilaceae bacterium]|nr:hypothetical protein [Thermoleophilaceae bacterium]
MRTRIFMAAAIAAGALAIAGCGSSGSKSGGSTKAANPNKPEVSPAGDIPDNQAYVAYTPPGAGFSIKVPEGWARTTTGGATKFADKLNSVVVESVPARSAPTVQDAKSTDVPRISAGAKHFKLGKVSIVKRTAGPAVLITYTVDSPADPVTGKVTTDAVERYVFFNKGKRIVVTLTGAKGADNVDPWKIVTNSVRFSG